MCFMNKTNSWTWTRSGNGKKFSTTDRFLRVFPTFGRKNELNYKKKLKKGHRKLHRSKHAGRSSKGESFSYTIPRGWSDACRSECNGLSHWALRNRLASTYGSFICVIRTTLGLFRNFRRNWTKKVKGMIYTRHTMSTTFGTRTYFHRSTIDRFLFACTKNWPLKTLKIKT